MEQFHEVTGLDIENPDYAKIKPWPAGSLVSWTASNNQTTTFALSLARPLGEDVPVFYGNSEITADGGLHGWTEGALEMVELHLQSIATYLGFQGEVVPADRSGTLTNEQILANTGDPCTIGGSDPNSESDGDGSGGQSAAISVLFQWLAFAGAVGMIW